MGETSGCFRSPQFWVYFSPCLFPKKTVFPKYTSGHASSVLKFHLWRPSAYGIKARPFITVCWHASLGPQGWPGCDVFLRDPAGCRLCLQGNAHAVPSTWSAALCPPHELCSKALAHPLVCCSILLFPLLVAICSHRPACHPAIRRAIPGT